MPTSGSQVSSSFSPKGGNRRNICNRRSGRRTDLPFPFQEEEGEEGGEETKMMHMTLYWSRYVTLLVDQWRTDTWTSYLLTLIACFLSASFYQYLENRRLRIQSLIASSPPLRTSDPASFPLIVKLGRNRAARAVSSAMFGISSAVGYLLMLAIMSFNGGVFLAIVAGLSVGYYIFRSSTDDKEVGKFAAVVDNPCACA